MDSLFWALPMRAITEDPMRLNNSQATRTNQHAGQGVAAEPRPEPEDAGLLGSSGKLRAACLGVSRGQSFVL